jgi:hypothetical protein
MSARSRKPTDDQQPTAIYDSKRPQKPTKRGVAKHGDDDETTVRSEPPQAVEIGTPTEVVQAKSEPIRVVSMKTPGELAAERRGAPAKEHQMKIRPLSDVRRAHDTPAGGFGTLAPPRDPKQVAVRKLRDFVIWGCAVVIVACGVMLGVWFLAKH